MNIFDIDLTFSGWMEGQDDDKHKTDVHYRSMDGEGMFNWRWILPFKYMPEERVMVVEKKVGCCFVLLDPFSVMI